VGVSHIDPTFLNPPCSPVPTSHLRIVIRLHAVVPGGVTCVSTRRLKTPALHSTVCSSAPFSRGQRQGNRSLNLGRDVSRLLRISSSLVIPLVRGPIFHITTRARGFRPRTSALVLTCSFFSTLLPQSLRGAEAHPFFSVPLADRCYPLFHQPA